MGRRQTQFQSRRLSVCEGIKGVDDKTITEHLPSPVGLMLHLQHMETIGVRELQQRASAALRRVQQGESLGVTDRGRLVAVLVPPSVAGGTAALDRGWQGPARQRHSARPSRAELVENLDGAGP